MYKYCLIFLIILFLSPIVKVSAQGTGQLEVERTYDIQNSEVSYKLLIKNDSKEDLIKSFSIILPFGNYELKNIKGALVLKNINDLKIDFSDGMLEPGFSKEVSFTIVTNRLVDQQNNLYFLDISNFTSNININRVQTKIIYPNDFPELSYHSRNIQKDANQIIFLENKGLNLIWGNEFSSNFIMKLSNISDPNALIPIIAPYSFQQIEYLANPDDAKLLFDKSSNGYLISDSKNVALKGYVYKKNNYKVETNNINMKNNYEFPEITGNSNNQKVEEIANYLEKSYKPELFKELDTKFEKIENHDLSITLYTYFWLNKLDINSKVIFGKNFKNTTSSYWILWQDGDVYKAFDPSLYFSDQIDVYDQVPTDRIVLTILDNRNFKNIDEFIQLIQKNFYWYFGPQKQGEQNLTSEINLNVIFPEQSNFASYVSGKVNIENKSNQLLEIITINSNDKNILDTSVFNYGLFPNQYKVLEVNKGRNIFQLFKRKMKLTTEVQYVIGEIDDKKIFENNISFGEIKISRRFVLLALVISSITYIVILIAKKILAYK